MKSVSYTHLPININSDHSDAMGVRDAGWLMLFAETNQEAYDNYLQAMQMCIRDRLY